MKLIIGGAYQGKLDFAKKRFGVCDSEIFTCVDIKIDPDFPCVYALEEYTYACICQEIDPISWFEENRDRWAETVFICQDIFCGIVPMDRKLRLWRDATGKLCQYLTREAEEVYRIICGLEQKLK